MQRLEKQRKDTELKMEEGKYREWGAVEKKEKDRERGKDGGVRKGGDPCPGPGSQAADVRIATWVPPMAGRGGQDTPEDVPSWRPSAVGLPSLCPGVQSGDFSGTLEQLICVAD